jgi:pyridoxamine 5'-phosphate oxidase family protein
LHDDAFTSAEVAYLESQRLARIATAGSDGQPHVVPVSFRYNPDEDSIDVGGHGFAQRKKYRDVRRNPRVAIVIDDLASIDPWLPRMMEIRGKSGGTADRRRKNWAWLRSADVPHTSPANHQRRHRRGWAVWSKRSVSALIAPGLACSPASGGVN